MDNCLSLESGNKQEMLAGKLNGKRRHEDTVKREQIGGRDE